MIRATITIDDLKLIWRIVVGVVVLQILGGIVGAVMNVHYMMFMNVWVGGAVATPVGFAVGLYWHLASRPRPMTPKVLVTFLGLIAVVIGGASIFVGLKMSAAMKNLAALRSLPPGSITRIVVYGKYGDGKLFEISDPSILIAFEKACTDVEGYSPNHPSYSDSWRIELIGESQKTLNCHYRRGAPNRVCGKIVRTKGISAGLFGSFQSVQLRKWWASFIENPNGVKKQPPPNSPQPQGKSPK